MHGAEGSRESRTQYVVLTRTCADLYQEMAAVFVNWPGIKVVVDWGSQPRFSYGFLDMDDTTRTEKARR